MIEKINGFLILRKSSSMDKVEPYNRVFRIGKREYRGMERAHLYDVIEEYYENKLPVELHLIVKMAKEESNDLLFTELIKDFENAKKLFEYIGKKNDFNEIIAIDSDMIGQIKGAIKFDSKEIKWLGYDITAIGNGSLILNGLFFKPQYFDKWIQLINENGLFTEKKAINEYIVDYLKYAKDNIVEDHNFPVDGFNIMRIGRVLW